MLEKNKRRAYYGAYTAGTLVMFAFLFWIFASRGKSFIRDGDGLRQHYTSLSYYGTYLRSIAKTLIFEHRLEIPMWDLNIGYGTDVLTTLHYYTIGDPLNLLSALVPARYTEYLFDFLNLLRIYLAGITFSMYCFYHKNKPHVVWMGSMIYIFSHWTMVAGFNHPYFLNPCIYLPLILIGVDKIFDGKKPLLYILSITLAGISNFYFFYMLGIFTVIYAVFRYIVKFGRTDLKTLMGWLGKFALYSISGILMAGTILLPVVMAVLGTGRMNEKYFVPTLYSPQYYKLLAATLVGDRSVRFTVIGVAGIAFLAVLVLFTRRKKYTDLKVGVVLFAFMLCIPYVGHVMNGFSYVSNRWIWAAIMLVSYIFVKMYPEFFSLTNKQRWIILGITAAYCGFMVFCEDINVRQNQAAGILLLLLCVIFVTGYSYFKKNQKIWAAVVAVSIFISIGTGSWYYFDSEKGSQIITDYVDRGTAYSKTHGMAEKALKAYPGLDAARFGQNNSGMLYNAPVLNDLYGGQFYFSMAPYEVADFFNKVYMNNPVEQLYVGLNNRAWLMKMFSMRYYVGLEGNVPYGFGLTEQLAPNGLGIFEDKNPLPFAYTYDSAISQEDFEKMNLTQRQESMMMGAVLEESSLPETELTFHSEEVPYKVTEVEGMKWDGKHLRVKRKGASCVLEVEGAPLSETVLGFETLKYLGIKPWAKEIMEPADITTAEVNAQVEGDSDANKQELYLHTFKKNFRSARENPSMNLGYRAEPVTRIKLTFGSKGIYEIKDMKVYCQKMENLNTLADARKAEAPSDLKISGNHISCSVDFSQDRALVFSIPYNKGWSLKVDGEKAELKKANHVFLAAELPEGKHVVELSYATPYIRLGILTTILGILLTVGIIVYPKGKKK